MKAHIQIPRGWRRLREGVRLSKADRYLSIDTLTLDLFWESASVLTQFNSEEVVRKGSDCIRKIKAPKGGKAK